MKLKVFCNMGLVGCRREDEIEVDDDCTDEELDEMAREWMWNFLDFGWEKVPE